MARRYMTIETLIKVNTTRDANSTEDEDQIMLAAEWSSCPTMARLKHHIDGRDLPLPSRTYDSANRFTFAYHLIIFHRLADQFFLTHRHTCRLFTNLSQLVIPFVGRQSQGLAAARLDVLAGLKCLKLQLSGRRLRITR